MGRAFEGPFESLVVAGVPDSYLYNRRTIKPASNGRTGIIAWDMMMRRMNPTGKTLSRLEQHRSSSYRAAISKAGMKMDLRIRRYAC
eukprot:scaffold74747_cov34-Prasinocladus_malaysianus.AAC.2